MNFDERDAYLLLIILVMLTFTATNYTWESFCGSLTIEERPYVAICQSAWGTHGDEIFENYDTDDTISWEGYLQDYEVWDIWCLMLSAFRGWGCA